MKRIISLLAGALAVFSLTGCSLFHQHEWIEATCTEPKTCAECGETEGEPLGHDFKDATCTLPKICSRCGQIDGHSLGHNVKYEVTKEATCGEDGLEEGVCSRCKETLKKVINATGDHTLSEWKETKKATCTEKGKKEATCTVCGKVFSEDIAQLDHVDDGKWVVVKSATADSAGKKATHCKTCGKEMQTESYELSMEEKNALRKADSYISIMPFSRKGLIEQLKFEGYSEKAAKNAVDSLDIDWNEQAALKAQSYIDIMAFSKSGLIDQLMFEGFTREQAEYGVKAVGY